LTEPKNEIPIIGEPYDKTIPVISYQQIEQTKLIEQRGHIVNFLDNEISFIEVGTGSGDFAEEIIKSINPRNAILIDTFPGYYDVHGRHDTYKQEEFVRERFSNNNNIKVISGDSKVVLPSLHSMSSEKYDFIYLDADHSLEQLSSDLLWASKLLKDSGIIGIDDFCFHPDYIQQNTGKYQAQEAVSLFLKSNPEWKIKYFSLNVGGFHNVFLSKNW